MLAMTFPLAPMQVQAKDAPPPLEGIHIHRSGTSPFTLNAAKEMLKASEGQCKLLKQVCATMPAGAKPGDITAACAGATGVFSLKGNMADVGKLETDEYFATDMKMAARQTKKAMLRVKSVCETEVVEYESRDIWHYTPSGYTHYELKDSKKGAWHTEHKKISLKTGALLVGVLPVTAATTVSPVSGKKTYAGHKCDVREFSGPWSGTLCLKATHTPFPGQVKLAGTVIAGKDTLLEDAATEVEEKVMLPYDYFYPPAGEIAKSKQSTPAPSENATQKWCAKQKAKTGVNPCGANDADE